MKPRSQQATPQPELQELLQKPASLPRLADRNRRATIIPSQSSTKEKSRVPSSPEEDSDVVSAIIGNYGRWQLLMTFLLSLFSLPCTFHIYLPTFTAKQTKFWCRRPDNFTSLPLESWINYSQPIDACSVRTIPAGVTVESILNFTAPLLDSFQECKEWEYDRSEVGNTIISEWNLVCDKANLTNLAEVVFLIGVGVGGVVGGWISDKFGRKRVLMAMMVAQSALAILSLLVRSYIQYVVVRLIMGFVSVSVVYAAFVLSVELVGGKWVTIAGVCNFFPLPLAYLTVSLLSLLMPNWRDLQLSLSIPGCLLLGLWFVLPESPRWLLSMGKTQEAKVILQKVVKFNKREMPADIDKLLMLSKSETQEEGPSVAMLLKGTLRKRTICLFLAWYCMTIAYYGLLLNIGNFNIGNLHVTSIILAVVEIPAIALSIPILLKAGRRYPIFISMLACGLACIASELFSIAFAENWIMIACLMVGKFAIGCTNMMLPIFTVELYPTVVRNLGVGASQISAGLALICIPYLWKLTILNEHLPMVTIAALAFVGGAIILALPETSKQDDTRPTAHGKIPAFDSASPCNGTFTLTTDRGHSLTFGRKRVLMAMMVAQSALAILSLLVRSYIQYVVVRLIMGFVSVSVVYAAFVLSVELVGGKWVTIAGVCNFFPLPLAYLTVSLLSLLMPNWRDLQLSLSIPGCLLLGLWFVLPESPRWLLSMGKTQEAKVILQKVVKFNKREMPADIDKLLMLSKSETQEEGPSVAMLLKGTLRKRTICLFLAWYCMTIAYYGLLLNIGNFNIGNLHVTSIILAVVEIPAIALSIPILLKAGRRYPIFISMLACGLACIASELFSIAFAENWIMIACLMVGKFAIGCTNMMLPIFTVELYPTVVRNLGVGASQISAGLALICIPYLWKLTILNEHLPMVTIAALAFVGGAIILALPETSKQDDTRPTAHGKIPAFDSASPCNGTFTLTTDRGHSLT